jgi:hypothetical protein
MAGAPHADEPIEDYIKREFAHLEVLRELQRCIQLTKHARDGYAELIRKRAGR